MVLSESRKLTTTLFALSLIMLVGCGPGGPGDNSTDDEFTSHVSSAKSGCSDSDSGKDYYTKGYVRSTVGPYAPEGGWDGCLDAFFSSTKSGGTYLSETFCAEDGRYASDVVLCPYGCRDGACQAGKIPATCKDSDGGSDPYKEGYVYSSTDPNVPRIHDRCTKNAFGRNRVNVLETYCNEDGMFDTRFVDCPFGCVNGACLRSAEKVLVVVDSALAQSLDTELKTFTKDLKSDTGKKVVLLKGTWAAATQVKKRIVQYGNVEGILLVGDIPFVEFASAGDPGLRWVSDYYYADLAGACRYNATYGFYDVESCSAGRGWYADTWVARLKPSTDVDRLRALRRYFAKNHRYRTGKLTFAKRLLYFNAIAKDNGLNDSEIDSYIGKEVDQGIVPGSLYGSSALSKLIAKSNTLDAATRAEYLTALSKNYEWVLLNAHGWYGGHQYDISAQDLLAARPNGLFYELKSCSLGNLNFGSYAAGSYVFSDGNGLLALANTSAVAEFNYSEDDSIAMFMLSRGVAFADALRDKLNVYKVLIGDPTLRLRRSVPKSRAKIEVSRTVFDLGTVGTERQEHTVPVVIKNTGDKPLRVNVLTRPVSLRSDDSFFFYASIYQYQTIAAGQEKACAMKFRISTRHKGKYQLEGASVVSDADNRPLVKTRVIFEVK